MRYLISCPYNFLLSALAIFILAGCSAESKKARLLERAGGYFDKGEFDSAKIEYMNLLREDPQNGVAIARLGNIWFDQGAPIRALPFLRKARELDPEDFDVRAKLAFAYLSVGAFEEARGEAVEIFGRAPGNDEAAMLLIDTAKTAESIEETEKLLGQTADKNTVGYHLASSGLAWRKGEREAAEESTRRALELDPRSVLVRLGMARIHIFKRELDKAEEEFRKAAELAPARSIARLKYPEFKIQRGDVAGGKALLEAINKEVPDYLPAWQVLAETAFKEEEHDRALKLLENVLIRDPSYFNGLLLKAQVQIAGGDLEKAIAGLKRIKDTYPGSPVVEYQLARSYLLEAAHTQAAAALERALKLDPDYLDAVLLRAQLDLRRGDAAQVVNSMEEVLKRSPDLLQAQMVLADAYRVLGRLKDTEEIFRAQVESDPQSIRPKILLGMILRQQNRNGEARQIFEQIQQISPDNLMVINQIFDIDIIENNLDEAFGRATGYLAKNPDSAGAHFMLGKLYAARKDWEQAEKSLLNAIGIEANFLSAYELLITSYLAMDKLPQAIGQLEGFHAKNPANVSALMQLALMYAEVGEFEKSAESYNKIISADPGFAPAFNNLAVLYAEHLGQLEKAQTFAQQARTLMPEDGSVADTLGWIAYQRKNYSQAMALIQDSAGKLPGNAEVQFHLGMASYMMGQEEAARAALGNALASGKDFSGREEAEKRMEIMGGEWDAGALAALSQERPEDVVVLMLLGHAREKSGQFVPAAEAYMGALKVNPNLPIALMRLAQLYAGSLGDVDRALGYAKKARELSPNNPQVTGVLGQVAFKKGDFAWAHSLLGESLSRAGENPEILYDFAWASYSQGKMDEAIRLMERYSGLVPEPSKINDSRMFLAMTVPDMEALLSAGTTVERALAGDPGYVPGLMARAAIRVKGGEKEGAGNDYETILTKYPDFIPAMKELAILYSGEPERLDRAYELAVKARQVLPDDPGLAKALAVTSYGKNEFAYALQLLEGLQRAEPLDGQGLYYLGMSQLKVGREKDAHKSLSKALEVGLEEGLSAEVNRELKKLE